MQSAYGRIARRQGKCELAVERFERAIAEIRQGGAGTLPLARTLMNLAFVKRLLAVEAQKELDSLAELRRGKCAASAAPGGCERLRIEEIRAQARQCLAEASEIYGRLQNHSGMAAVRITEGFLHLDAGDLERASAEAAEAFAQSSAKSDSIGDGARPHAGMHHRERCRGRTGGSLGQHREAAVEIYAREAVAFAGSTENRRLQARALVWQGLTNTLETIGSLRRRAAAASRPWRCSSPRAWNGNTFGTTCTRRRVKGTASRWMRCCGRESAGMVEGQSFQQLTEEFARIVIPRVWEREGRKVSRVADKLSISPKKVRRILHASGTSKTDV